MTFKELRKNAELTTKQVAAALKIKLDTYQKYECSVRLPNASILAQMPGVYKCSGDDVINAYKHAKEVNFERYRKTDS
ncbi:UNVERIFIED_ORG: hypothetical protein B2H98_18340 [Clostridium botulinum]